MRTDQNLGRKSFRYSDSWKEDKAAQKTGPSIDSRLEGYEVLPDGKVLVHSLSGNETNRLFLNQGGEQFENASAISGLDNPADSRGWALLDYDRDGWQDVALVNANNPLVNLYRNEIGSVVEHKSGGILALRFIGGGAGFTTRDGFGAMVSVTLSDGTILKREHRCGDGYSSQNSSTMMIGIGDHQQVSQVTVKWPSGKTSSTKDIKEGTLLTAFETNEETPFQQEAYRHQASPPVQTTTPGVRFPSFLNPPEEIRVYTTTATWCTACLSHFPALQELKDKGIPLIGLPVDPADDEAALDDYLEKKNPPYSILTGLNPEQKDRITKVLAKELGTENPPLPSSVIVDAEGRILKALTGVPTLSQIRKWSAKDSK